MEEYHFGNITIYRILNKPVNSNCFVIVKGSFCIIVDPGECEMSNLRLLLKKRGVSPQYIILTHEHYDHIAGCNSLRSYYPMIKVIASLCCSQNIQNDRWNLSRYKAENGEGFVVDAADIVISVDTVSYLCEIEVHFLLTPGHSLGSMCFWFDNHFFSGDTVLPGYKPVLKLKGGDKMQYEDSLKKVAMIMRQKEMILYPGHGLVQRRCIDVIRDRLK